MIGDSTIVKPLDLHLFNNTAQRTIRGWQEIMNVMRKGQIKNVEKGAVKERVLLLSIQI